MEASAASSVRTGCCSEQHDHGIAVLHDCAGFRGKDLPVALVAELKILPQGWVTLLYNLDRQAGIEKMGLQQGIRGFIYLDDPAETLIRALTAVFGGELWIPRQKMTELITGNGFRTANAPDHTYPHELTRREVAILELLTSGATNEAIAAKLFISPHTVRTHLNNIFKKIKASNRVEASMWAITALFTGRYPV